RPETVPPQAPQAPTPRLVPASTENTHSSLLPSGPASSATVTFLATSRTSRCEPQAEPTGASQECYEVNPVPSVGRIIFVGLAVGGDGPLQRFARAVTRLVAGIKEDLLIGTAERACHLHELGMVLLAGIARAGAACRSGLAGLDKILPVKPTVPGILWIAPANDLRELPHQRVFADIAQPLYQSFGGIDILATAQTSQPP